MGSKWTEEVDQLSHTSRPDGKEEDAGGTSYIIIVIFVIIVFILILVICFLFLGDQSLEGRCVRKLDPPPFVIYRVLGN